MEDDPDGIFRAYVSPCNAACKYTYRVLRPEDEMYVERSFNEWKIAGYKSADTKIIHEPDKLPAMKILFECREWGLKNVAVLLYGNMSVIFTGAINPEAAQITAQLATSYLIEKLAVPLEIANFEVMTFVYKMESPWAVDLPLLAERLGPEKCTLKTWSPSGKEAFPAARINAGGGVKYIVPKSGKTIVTGCKELEEIKRHVHCAYVICWLFRIGNRGASFDERVQKLLENL